MADADGDLSWLPETGAHLTRDEVGDGAPGVSNAEPLPGTLG